MDVPIHPLRWADDGAIVLLAFADGLQVLFCDELLVQQLLESGLQGRGIGGCEVILELLPHEHTVGADINDAPLFKETGDEFLDLRVDQRFASANGHHGSIAFLRGLEAILQRHHVLEAGRVFPDTTATRASEVAGVQRF